MESRSPEETRRLAVALSPLLRPGDVVSLGGDLGAGKTTFVQGLAVGLGIRDRVTSPSLVLLKEYLGGPGRPVPPAGPPPGPLAGPPTQAPAGPAVRSAARGAALDAGARHRDLDAAGFGDHRVRAGDHRVLHDLPRRRLRRVPPPGG